MLTRCEHCPMLLMTIANSARRANEEIAGEFDAFSFNNIAQHTEFARWVSMNFRAPEELVADKFILHKCWIVSCCAGNPLCSLAQFLCYTTDKRRRWKRESELTWKIRVEWICRGELMGETFGTETQLYRPRCQTWLASILPWCLLSESRKSHCMKYEATGEDKVKWSSRIFCST